LALAALVVCVGATNVYNFMDGINGITAGYSGVVLLSVLMADAQQGVSVDRSLCVVMLLAVVVFAIFNFRPRGKAKCFAGNVGSVGIALILLFMIGQIIVRLGLWCVGSVSRLLAGPRALGLFDCSFGGAGSCLCALQEEVLLDA
ncbi:MAG: hypothetical protein KBT08_03710, partial [Bacteroidales bacterium]|nr:hypothetical protein [Candidatus Cryptobacteroides onthequi]